MAFIKKNFGGISATGARRGEKKDGMVKQIGGKRHERA
jgi:hypothetical protein